jgi:hypothetical protein
MVLARSALLDLHAQLKPADVTDRIGVATEKLQLKMINAEAPEFIGVALFERTTKRRTHPKTCPERQR